MVDRALVLFTDSRLVSDLVTACLDLPLCSFATPETWSGMCLELSHPPQRTVLWVCCMRLQHHVRLRFGVTERIYTDALVHLQAGMEAWC